MSDGKDKTGSVIVVGGGIGGMQASLDLAESGYKVYLVEKNSSIGGTMAQLDKTFPTNDCAMCTLAPRLIDVGQHPDIVKIPNAEIGSIEGDPGNFTVTVKRKATYIDSDKCTGCSSCIEKCPIKVDSEFDLELIKRNAIYRRYPQAVPNTFAVDKRGVSPCRLACPAGVNAHAYVALIAQRRYEDAIEVVRRVLPFSSICGRLCHHPCEGECNRKDVDEAVNIRVLKSFIVDKARSSGETPPEIIKPEKDERIAIVGAGPAGLTCAVNLLERGYQVIVYEASSKAGGMITSSIPEYRLSAEVANYDIDRLLAKGIEIVMGKRIGRDIPLSELKDKYDALFVATGYQGPAKLQIEGVDTPGVFYGLPLLKDVKTRKHLRNFGKDVVVIGGGNVAIDTARTALRMGAKDVKVVCLETRDLEHKDRMPAHSWEIEEAEEEGVLIHGSYGPKKILSKGGKVSGIEVAECVSVYDIDSEGKKRFAPKFADGATKIIFADTVIISIGQSADLTGFEELEKGERGTIKTDPLTLETSVKGIFAGGDIVRGPASVIEAVDNGNEASNSIDRYLSGLDLREGRGERPEIAGLPERKIEKKKRHNPNKLDPEKRAGSFEEVEVGFGEDEAVAEAERCLSCSVCCECLYCVDACEANAVIHQMEKETVEVINTGAIILAPGAELYPGEQKPEYGYERYPNVLSSLQFERILSSSGPFQGRVLRPSDNKHPKNVAWIQCVGSREADRDYCSSICCMYATKEAIIAKEHRRDLDCTIFYIDMRAFGKGYDQYFNRAKELGVKYVRSRPSSIKEIPSTQNLKLRYVENGEVKMEEFDMVILSLGLQASEEGKELAGISKVELNEYGFITPSDSSPVETSRPGIYACGTFLGPKDIPETVVEASAGASQAMTLLSDQRGSLITHKEYVAERDVKGEEPRIGVFVCHCGKNIGGVADVPEIVEYAKTLPNVIYAEDNLYTCSVDTQERIKKAVVEKGLNRVIVASCTPRTHESLFRNTCREAGLNEYLFELANIRDQNTWVHMLEPAKATKKGKDIVRMAAAKSRLLEPLYRQSIPISHTALVVGGGMSGMTAALNLADQGFEVHLVEMEDKLGGHFRHIYSLLDGRDPTKMLEERIAKVSYHSKINLHLSSKITAFAGSSGNFSSSITSADGTAGDITHGVVVVASGADKYRPTEYLYDVDERVITQHRLEDRFKNNEISSGLKSVVMIQCVGSREPERPYCSRICCQQAIKNALVLKGIDPDIDIFILYRDIRTYGFTEKYYTKAREKGVRFIRYNEDNKSQVSNDGGKLSINVYDDNLGDTLTIKSDMLVLAPAIVHRDNAEELNQLFKISLTQEKFFLEAHMKLRPIDFATEGIFMCGLAHAPKTVNESIAQALGAASRAATILSKDRLELEAAISEVVDENCDGCAYCIDPCPFNALTLIEYMSNGSIKKTVERDEVKCKGCGICQATCPKGGIFVRHFKLAQLNAMVEAALEL